MGYSIWDYNQLTKTFDPNLMGHYYVISIKICWFHFSIASSGRFEARIDQALAMTLPPPSMVPGTAQLALMDDHLLRDCVCGQNLGTKIAISEPFFRHETDSNKSPIQIWV